MISAAAASPGKDHSCKLRDSPCVVCTGVRKLLDQKSALEDKTADLHPPYSPKPPLSCIRVLVCSFQSQPWVGTKAHRALDKALDIFWQVTELEPRVLVPAAQLCLLSWQPDMCCQGPFLASLVLHHFPNPQRHLPGSSSTPDVNLVSLESKQILQPPPPKLILSMVPLLCKRILEGSTGRKVWKRYLLFTQLL